MYYIGIDIGIFGIKIVVCDLVGMVIDSEFYFFNVLFVYLKWLE